MANPFEKPIYITSPLLPNAEDAANKISEIWESGQITNNGKQHKELTEQLEAYLQAPHLSLFNNGTLALLLGLKALGLTGEVITTPFTFPATVQALDWNGLTPVFCDIDPITLNIDASKIEALITERTSAILAVHVFGNPCDVEQIGKIAEKYKLKVIYDGAHVFGAKLNGRPISDFGDMTMFSFHATKLFNTIEGGALSVKSEDVLKKLNLLKNFGILNPEEVVLSGLNAKMNEVQAGIGIEVLKLVEEERSKRHQLMKLYEHNLAEIPGIRPITVLEGEESSYQYFVIEVDEQEFGFSRDWLHRELEKYNVYTRKYFYPLCSDFEWYRQLESAKPENLPKAQKAVKEVLSMPYYGKLPLEAVNQICQLIKELQQSSKALTRI
ncbi:dTDP-4-amino-4,6-dideoxy-D-glucose transaminase [Planococcus massiliensis]|uniref:dTDP-4-amino-4,6-dideoxy-D-glucose transaminase n=1 Tax=Planococcus massiliensis TaxID=1499687 RepID=A0A098ELF8_9BACL|nr:DegT/DnrJ/EryC1/StrS family aminotransferase [Planococcus massiliensis]CEG22106.1 dTDP-4-amino-4,6-dideoxy-D-glucose transaminase [Planococcus massiliensis]